MKYTLLSSVITSLIFNSTAFADNNKDIVLSQLTIHVQHTKNIMSSLKKNSVL